LITTIFLTSPEIIEPDFVTELVTSTAMYCGTVGGGPELFPGSLFQGTPQTGGFGVELA